MGAICACSDHPNSSVRDWRFEACGDSCVVLVFATVFSLEINRRAAVVSSKLHEMLALGLLPGVTDIVPAMVSVGVHYSPDVLATLDPQQLPFDTICMVLEDSLRESQGFTSKTSKRLEISVCYEPDFAPDLLDIAQACSMTPQEVIAAHTGEWVDVLMVGFAPGHPYIGMHASSLALPRRVVPRTRVKQGSVGLANCQSVIYPSDPPGGWNIVGRTPLNMFSPASEPPCLLQGGDQVRFVSITAREFEQMTGEQPWLSR